MKLIGTEKQRQKHKRKGEPQSVNSPFSAVMAPSRTPSRTSPNASWCCRAAAPRSPRRTKSNSSSPVSETPCAQTSRCSGRLHSTTPSCWPAPTNNATECLHRHDHHHRCRHDHRRGPGLSHQRLHHHRPLRLLRWPSRRPISTAYRWSRSHKDG
jgi:hypothetical protein